MKLTGVRRRRAHNPEDPGSKPGVAKDFFFVFLTFTFLQLHTYLPIQNIFNDQIRYSLVRPLLYVES